MIILFIILITIGTSLIQDFLTLVKIQNYLNPILIYLTTVLLTYLMILLFLKTKGGKEIEKIASKRWKELMIKFKS